MKRIAFVGLAGALLALGPAAAQDIRPVLPQGDAANGQKLFVSKYCVVCHSINSTGGQNAAPLDAADMDASGNVYEFFARMWLGSGPMTAMQDERFGEQVELTAQELGDIVAFIHDAEAQAAFTDADVPDQIEDLIE